VVIMPERLSRTRIAMLFAALGGAAFASPPPDYGFDFVTIGAINNRAYEGGGQFGAMALAGRGSVSYEYRIGRLEVSTAQWFEFANTIAPLSPDPRNFARPSHWGARLDPFQAGVYHMRDVPNAAMIPVDGLTWREAAMYCNWLHNGKQATWESVQSGAYDASTFFTDSDGNFTDQATRSPGAKYWIPSLDEWIKAAHFDPNADDPDHPGTGRWWEYSNSSDTAPIGGEPGYGGETSAGVTQPVEHFTAWTDIPLGAYPDVLTPWGLLDASGGASEWSEEIFTLGTGPRYRGLDGSEAGDSPGDLDLDLVWARNSVFPTGGTGGLRIASAVPAPGAGASVVLAVGLVAVARRRR
jgi:formylglycine-generating enzyme required for sulfatase activity